MANVTQTSMADAIKTQYETRLLTRAKTRLIHARWATKANLNKHGSYEVRKYGSLASVTSPLVEGTTPSEQAAPSISKVTMTPLFYGAWMGYTDEVEMTAMDPLVLEVSGILGDQCGLSADTIVRDVLVAGATIDYSGNRAARTDLTSGIDDISYADFVKQIAALEYASALPMEGERFICIISPHSWATLMQDPTFVALFVRADATSAIRTGYVGTILRCDVYVTANAKEFVDGGASSADVYSALFLGRESFGAVGMSGGMPSDVDMAGPNGGPLTGKDVRPVKIILKPIGSAGADDPLDQRGTIAWKMDLDVDVLNADWIRSLEHTNEFSAD
jgi:N4-gp56 family major capsid protein